MTNLSFLHSITFIRLRVLFEALEPIVLPEYKGSAYRGCLGETMRNQVCNYRGLDCEKCKEKYSCSFSQLFNSFVAPDHPHCRKYSKSPHPYIIDPLPGNHTEFESGDRFGFDLTLIGQAIDHLPLVLHALYLMGETGIGKGRGQFKPIDLHYLRSDMKYEALLHFGKPEILSLKKLPVPLFDNDRISIKLENPLRLKENGKLLRIPPNFNLFIERLYLRIGLLSHFHCSAPWSESGFEPTFGLTQIFIRDSSVQFNDWRRYSGTQDTTMNFDGITGHISYEGQGLNNWKPLIVLGSWLHAGSTATFGLGKYSLIDS